MVSDTILHDILLESKLKDDSDTVRDQNFVNDLTEAGKISELAGDLFFKDMAEQLNDIAPKFKSDIEDLRKHNKKLSKISK